MTGVLDASRRALIRIAVRHPRSSASTLFDALIDTGFTGDLVLLPSQVAGLGLPESGLSPGQLADGSRVTLPTCTCLLEWFGEVRQIEALIGAGGIALIGTELLAALRLSIDYPAGTFALDRETVAR